MADFENLGLSPRLGERGRSLHTFPMNVKLVRIAVLLLMFSFGCDAPKVDVVATIDSTIPGTEVYYRATLLGTTPLSLSRTTCNTYGFLIHDNNLVSDGWGEGIAFGKEDEDETRIMFLVPPTERGRFLTIETPWGMRTKLGSCSGDFHGTPNKMTTDFMKLVDDDGIRLELQAIPALKPSSDAELQLTLSATGTRVIEGYRPELMAFWGTLDTPWRHRNSCRMALDQNLSKISPAESFQLSMPIRTPDVAGDYSLFVVFHLFEEETGGDLAIGAVYSESRNLRLRY